MKTAVVAVAVAVLCAAAPALADQWNDKTILTISKSMMVPGATLTPGTYSFELTNPDVTQGVVSIFRQPDHTLVTTASAVPMKRPRASGDVVLTLEPTDSGTAPAIKGWFYPGSLYGHQFVYSDKEAKDIAHRTKTLVLSRDVAGRDGKGGVIHVIDANGTPADWHNDTTTQQEWNQWVTARPRNNTPANKPGSEATLIQDTVHGVRVDLDSVEDHPERYTSQIISVDAVVQDVLGPRLFTIDEPNWSDPEREVVVYLPTSLAAAVRQGDRVTVTGAMHPFAKNLIAGEKTFASADRDAELMKHPFMIASRLVGGDNHTALVIGFDPAPVGTSGSIAESSLPPADESGVGTHVHINGARVRGSAPTRGFFVETGGTTMFVLPADSVLVAPATGQTVGIDGVILQMPASAAQQLGAPAGANTRIHILATGVR